MIIRIARDGMLIVTLDCYTAIGVVDPASHGARNGENRDPDSDNYLNKSIQKQLNISTGCT